MESKRRGKPRRLRLRLMVMAWGIYRATPILLMMIGLLYQIVAPAPADGWTGLVWSILRRR